KTASDLGLVVSSLGKINEFVNEKFISILSEFPDLKIILEHLAGAIFNTENHTETSVKEFENIFKLSKYPNVFIKIPGLGELMQKPDILTRKPAFSLNHPLLKMTLDAFGSDRMMWGSDFPPVSFREGYKNSLNEIKDNPLFNQEDSDFIMGETAFNVFWKRN
ncbi:MAG: amidohydrolase family protein, partial [SAR202 cluster bacterium]|nr:amidohydrolase family protein [SAR202 cluster bacterium]